MATSVEYGSSQARGQIGAAASGLHHSQGNADLSCFCDLHHSSWQGHRTHVLMDTVRFIITEPQWELPAMDNLMLAVSLQVQSPLLQHTAILVLAMCPPPPPSLSREKEGSIWFFQVRKWKASPISYPDMIGGGFTLSGKPV